MYTDSCQKQVLKQDDLSLLVQRRQGSIQSAFVLATTTGIQSKQSTIAPDPTSVFRSTDQMAAAT